MTFLKKTKIQSINQSINRTIIEFWWLFVVSGNLGQSKSTLRTKPRPLSKALRRLWSKTFDRLLSECHSNSHKCLTLFTFKGFPPRGIIVFASQLHTHLTGVRVWTRHFRGGVELPELDRDNHYSTMFQEIRKLKRRVNVLPVRWHHFTWIVTFCDQPVAK